MTTLVTANKATNASTADPAPVAAGPTMELKGIKSHNNMPLKKTLEIGNANIDLKYINDGPEFCQDWLYDYPEFFHRESLKYKTEKVIEDLRTLSLFEEGANNWE